jgi:hypothetical protein
MLTDVFRNGSDPIKVTSWFLLLPDPLRLLHSPTPLPITFPCSGATQQSDYWQRRRSPFRLHLGSLPPEPLRTPPSPPRSTCHSSYGVVRDHRVSGVTDPPPQMVVWSTDKPRSSASSSRSRRRGKTCCRRCVRLQPMAHSKLDFSWPVHSGFVRSYRMVLA